MSWIKKELFKEFDNYTIEELNNFGWDELGDASEPLGSYSLEQSITLFYKYKYEYLEKKRGQ